MSTDKITFLTNWYSGSHNQQLFPLTFPARHATPYHAPLYLAQAKGFFAEQGIKVALLEPNDPSVSRITRGVKSTLTRGLAGCD